jgi:hypothetical protein
MRSSGSVGVVASVVVERESKGVGVVVEIE